MTTTIRRATLADAERATAITVRNFTETFGHQYPPEDLEYFLRTMYSLEAHRRILTDQNYALWLLEQDGEPIGHALAGPCGLPHPEASPDDGELKRLYILKRAQNSGWGGKLFETALDWLQRDGRRTVWIGVWSENDGAQRFYGRYGFGKVGEYAFPVGKTQDREFILRRSPAADEARNTLIR